MGCRRNLLVLAPAQSKAYHAQKLPASPSVCNGDSPTSECMSAMSRAFTVLQTILYIT